MSGTVWFDDDAISNPTTNNVYVTHASGSATLQLTNSTLTMAPALLGTQNDGLKVDGGTSGSLTAIVTGNTFTGAAGAHVEIAPGDGSGLTTNWNATWSANVSNNLMTSSEGSSNADDVGGGLTLWPRQYSGTFTYTVSGNTVRGAYQGAAINLNQGVGASTVSGSVIGNIIGIAGDEQSASFSGSGIVADAGGTGSHTVLIQSNVIHGDSETGITVDSAVGLPDTNPVGQPQLGASLYATVKDNTIGTPWTTGVGSLYGLYVNVGLKPGQTGTNCVDVQGNTLSGNLGGYVNIRYRKRSNVVLQAPGYAGAPGDTTAQAVTAMNTLLTTRNTLGVAGLSVSASGTGTFTNTPGGAACPQP